MPALIPFDRTSAWRLPMAAVAAALLPWLAGAGEPTPAEEPAPDEPPFEERAAELRRQLAAQAAADPTGPATLQARVALARLLNTEAGVDCAPHLDEAERELSQVLRAGPGHLLAWPDGLGDALSLQQSIHITRGLCAADEASARAAFQAAIATGAQAVTALRDNWDYDDMVIAQFNIAFARRELGDLDAALRDLEQVLDWDREFGLHGELEGDYSTYLRWQRDEEPDPDEIEGFLAASSQARARFRFNWKPYRSVWSTTVERSIGRNGSLQATVARYETDVTARAEGDGWIVSTTPRAAPQLETTGVEAGDAGATALRELLGGVLLWMPDIVIGPDGTFRELRDMDRFRGTLGQVLDKALAQALPGSDARTAEIISSTKAAVLDPELIAATVGGQWDFTVGAWSDLELDHGDWYEATVEEPLPGISRQPVRMTWRFRLARWLPCLEGGEPRCVEILAVVELDPDHVREATTAFVGRMAPAAERAKVEEAARGVDLRLEHRYRLVTEPDTLRPWSFEERKYVYGTYPEGGRRVSRARHDRTLQTIRYPAP